MNILTTINTVMGFFICNNYLLVSYKNKLRCYDKNLKIQWENYFQGNILKLSFRNENAYIEFINSETGFEETNLISILSGKSLKTTLTNFMIRDVYCDKMVIALKYNEDYSVNTFLIDLENEKIKWEKKIDGLPSFYNNSVMISCVKNQVISLSNEGTVNWIFNTKDIGNWFDYDKVEKSMEVSKILGIHKKEIFIYLNNGHILVLNLETGKKIAIITNDKNINQGFFSGSFSSNIQFDAINNKLIQLFRKTYTELDLDSKKVIQYEIPDLTKLNLENTANFVFDEKFIYFTDKNEKKLGKLNRENLKIQWEFSFTQISNNSNTYGRLLKLKGNYLYVLDNCQTLHIFEKDQNETT